MEATVAEARTQTQHTAPALADVVDTAHLARYTMGDEALERELLRMFAVQAEELLSNLEKATEKDAWRLAAHTLKGAARAIGAFPIAEEAARLERLSPEEGRRVLDGLRRRIARFQEAFRHWEESFSRYDSECA